MEIAIDRRTATNQARKEKSRKILLDAAVKVFARQGYHDTLVSDIVAEAGVGQGTFYRYFKDKREILDTVFEQFVEGLLGQFAEMSAHPENFFRGRSPEMPFEFPAELRRADIADSASG